MALILTRPGGVGSLLAAMFLGVPMCEIASRIWIDNPIWALVAGCVAALIGWVLFLLPVERTIVRATAGDPIDRLFDSRTLGWVARIGLTVCLLAGFHMVVIAVKLCLSPWHEMAGKGSFMAPVYRTMGIPGVSTVTSGIWVALAFASSLRPARTVASSVRFFNQVALFVLLGSLLLFRKALPSLTGAPFEWEALRVGPLWLYFSVASLAAPVLIAGWEREASAVSRWSAPASIAFTIAIGSLVPMAYVTALRMNGRGFTGSIDFLGAIWFPHSADPVLAGKGVFLALACFAWAQVAFLVFRGIWRTRLRCPNTAAAAFGLLAWRPWVDPMVGNWYWNVELAVATATFLSVLAGIIAGRALVTSWVKSEQLANLMKVELFAAGAGGIIAACALVWPNTALDIAPFATSLVLMVSVAPIQSGHPHGPRPLSS